MSLSFAAGSTSRPSSQIAARVPQGTQQEPIFAGRSAALQSALCQAERLARFDHVPVLIEGESGTGKSFFARYLHLRSPRKRGPLHQVILSTLDDNLASSDLFGHVSGAYTDARQTRPGHFVSANGGTLFLDEIGKASPAVQRKLLHAVEHNEVWPVGADRAVRLDVRLLAATNVSLETLVARGDFLPDLAARLSSFRVRVPALHERRADISALVEQFVAAHAARCGHPEGAPRVSDLLMRSLLHADWPNNLRQLDAVVQWLLMESVGCDTISLDHCVGDLRYLRDVGEPGPALTPAIVRARFEELRSVTATARSLGVSRWTIYRYLERAETIPTTAEAALAS